MNPDRTISDDEQSERSMFLASVEITIDELIAYMQEEAWRIGGPFRSPGVFGQAKKLVNEKLYYARAYLPTLEEDYDEV